MNSSCLCTLTSVKFRKTRSYSCYLFIDVFLKLILLSVWWPRFWTCHVHRKCIILHPSQMPVTWVLTSLWIFLESQQHSLCSSLLCVCLNHYSETFQFPQYRYLPRSLSIIQHKFGFDLCADVFASFVMLHFMYYTTKMSSFKQRKINMS